jgi:hypothetical protein
LVSGPERKFATTTPITTISAPSKLPTTGSSRRSTGLAASLVLKNSVFESEWSNSENIFLPKAALENTVS